MSLGFYGDLCWISAKDILGKVLVESQESLSKVPATPGCSPWRRHVISSSAYIHSEVLKLCCICFQAADFLSTSLCQILIVDESSTQSLQTPGGGPLSRALSEAPPDKGCEGPQRRGRRRGMAGKPPEPIVCIPGCMVDAADS